MGIETYGSSEWNTDSEAAIQAEDAIGAELALAILLDSLADAVLRAGPWPELAILMGVASIAWESLFDVLIDFSLHAGPVHRWTDHTLR